MLLSTVLVLNLCHWAGDYTHLSTSWMIKAKQYGKPLTPILCHALVHTVLMGVAMWIMHNKEKALFTAAMQLPTHFIIDVAKGRLNQYKPTLQHPNNRFYWWVFGLDQYLHHAVILITAMGICKCR
ncbi:MAG TPA: DUF3307 domain-containing protein [Cytophagales bacterium]|nr:DUF3307 domain-containing protein [Cytophagales bacterium]